ncbi:mycofactocin precursor MftA [Leekyejoonella antrihumi]|uniref:Mycofactocin n=1 Tax=Leekyejoonella antrihumi TaxID=1660198 RepID=A0A563DWA2_9MICO|nr:mycofactocin precursor MftA [Leekyejoonella antrihumi]TWP34222.1 mycofactocin precursor [Leekyejoonella antrihumi]
MSQAQLEQETTDRAGVDGAIADGVANGPDPTVRELTVDELIEDVSIDGMCGVY